MPSLVYTTRRPCRTPRYCFGASPLAFSSPCSCSRILIVSKECVTVTAPQAAMPPAMKLPMVVDMLALCAEEGSGLYSHVVEGIYSHKRV